VEGKRVDLAGRVPIRSRRFPGCALAGPGPRKSTPVKPVPEAFIDAIRGKALPPVWAMIELQRLTGMRPGEVTAMARMRLEHFRKRLDLRTGSAQDGPTPRPSGGRSSLAQERKTFLGTVAQDRLCRPFCSVPAKRSRRCALPSKSHIARSRSGTYAMLLKRSRRNGAPAGAPRAVTRSKPNGRAMRLPAPSRRSTASEKKADAEAVEIPHVASASTSAQRGRRGSGGNSTLEVARVIPGHRSPVV